MNGRLILRSIDPSVPRIAFRKDVVRVFAAFIGAACGGGNVYKNLGLGRVKKLVTDSPRAVVLYIDTDCVQHYLVRRI
jgi:hypothetical protein